MLSLLSSVPVMWARILFLRWSDLGRTQSRLELPTTSNLKNTALGSHAWPARSGLGWVCFVSRESKNGGGETSEEMVGIFCPPLTWEERSWQGVSSWHAWHRWQSWLVYLDALCIWCLASATCSRKGCLEFIRKNWLR